MPNIAVEVSKEIINELNVAAQAVMYTYKLGDTDLMRSIEWRYKDDLWVLWANDYFKFLNDGRRPGTKKIPVYALIKWLKKRNIQPRKKMTYNQLAYVISNSIYKIGIKPRKFGDPIINISSDILSEYIAETLSWQIVNQLATDLTVTIGGGQKN
jgi:hypothetical protein